MVAPNSHKQVLGYQIDENDIILSLSVEWLSFAERNCGGARCRPENIIGSSLWSFVHGLETANLYSAILQRVRCHKRPVSFPFRCDSPDCRRFLKLTVSPAEDLAIDFTSIAIRSETREAATILDCERDSSDEIISICSMCKKVAVLGTEWQEVEVAIVSLRLFEKEQLPQLSHGLCPSCYEETMAGLDREGA